MALPVPETGGQIPGALSLKEAIEEAARVRKGLWWLEAYTEHRRRILPADYFLGTFPIPESDHILRYLPVFGHLPPPLDDDDDEARFLKRDMRGKTRTSVFSKSGILREQ
ncbi:MAG: hypothetical protein Q9187_001683 [Circinaria calcarea]